MQYMFRRRAGCCWTWIRNKTETVWWQQSKKRRTSKRSTKKKTYIKLSTFAVLRIENFIYFTFLILFVFPLFHRFRSFYSHFHSFMSTHQYLEWYVVYFDTCPHVRHCCCCFRFFFFFVHCIVLHFILTPHWILWHAIARYLHTQIQTHRTLRQQV